MVGEKGTTPVGSCGSKPNSECDGTPGQALRSTISFLQGLIVLSANHSKQWWSTWTPGSLSSWTNQAPLHISCSLPCPRWQKSPESDRQEEEGWSDGEGCWKPASSWGRRHSPFTSFRHRFNYGNDPVSGVLVWWLFPMEGWCGGPVAPLELAPQWLETQSPSPCFVGHNVTLLQVQYLWLGCLQPTGTLQFSPTHWSRGESNTYPVNTTEQAK